MPISIFIKNCSNSKNLIKPVYVYIFHACILMKSTDDRESIILIKLDSLLVTNHIMCLFIYKLFKTLT